MTWFGWLALAAGLALVPVTGRGPARAHALADRGRLARLSAATGPRWPRPPVSARWAGVMVVAVVAVPVAMTRGAVLGAAAAVTTGTTAVLVTAALRGGAGRTRRRQLQSALGILVAELEAGSRPDIALAAAGPASPGHAAAFAAAAIAARAAGDVSPAFADHADLVPIAQAWELAARAGVPLSGALAHVVDDLAARARQARLVAGALAGPRSSAAVLAVLPALGIVLGASMGARPLPLLLDTPVGQALCLVGVLLDAAGLLWTHRLVSRAERR